jgi:hypothetical protein
LSKTSHKKAQSRVIKPPSKIISGKIRTIRPEFTPIQLRLTKSAMSPDLATKGVPENETDTLALLVTHRPCFVGSSTFPSQPSDAFSETQRDGRG